MGFICTRNSLIFLNILYMVVAVTLMVTAVYGKVAAYITSIPILSGMAACGVLLFFIAVMGFVGTLKHHQVLLFFYIIVMAMLFVVEFAIAIACLVVPTAQTKSLLSEAWVGSSSEMKDEVHELFDCCGFDGQSQNTLSPNESLWHPPCNTTAMLRNGCCRGSNSTCCVGTDNGDPSMPCPCDNCFDKLCPLVSEALTTVGSIGLFFSFTEIAGVVLAVRFRNLKDPDANPKLFL